MSVNGRSPQFIDAATIAAEHQETHTYRGPNGPPFTRSGVSLRTLLAQAGVNPDHVSLLEVPQARVGFAYLKRADLASPPDFADGPALVSVDQSSTRFLRPQRTTGDQIDDIATSSGSLSISVYTGRLLTATASHTPARPSVRQSVHFDGTSSSAGLPGETLSYTWSFDDNSAPKTGAQVTHAYARKGHYLASVQVKGDKGSVSLPATTTVQIGDARPGNHPGSGGHSGRNAPNHGAANGSPRGGSGHTGAGAGGNTTPSSSSAQTPASSTASPPAAARRLRLPPGGALTPVRGVLIAGPGTLLAAAAPASAPTGAQASARAGSLPAPGIELPLGILAAAGIFSAGAVRERRRPRLGTA